MSLVLAWSTSNRIHHDDAHNDQKLQRVVYDPSNSNEDPLFSSNNYISEGLAGNIRSAFQSIWL